MKSISETMVLQSLCSSICLCRCKQKQSPISSGPPKAAQSFFFAEGQVSVRPEEGIDPDGNKLFLCFGVGCMNSGHGSA